jgi:hypothetical protein
VIASLLRGPGALTLRRCLVVAALPTAAVAAGSLLLHHVLAPSLGGHEAPAASSPWLVLPLLAAAMTCTIVAVVFWPVIAKDRPGAGWVERLQRGRLCGRGGAVAGALGAQLLLSLPLTTLLAALLGAPSSATPRYELTPPADPALDGRRESLAFDAPPGEVFCEVWLRPVVFLPAGTIVPTEVELRGDGELLLAGTATFVDTHRLVRVQVAERPFRRLELVRVRGTLPLFFGPGDVTLVGATPHSNLLNGVIAAAIALLPSFVALAFACWCGLVAALPTAIAVATSLVFVQTVGGVGPQAAAVMAVLRGQWLPASPVFPQCATSLALGSLAMIVTMLLRPWARR